MRKLLIAALLATPAFFALDAMAEKGGDRSSKGEAKFAEMDINGDGFITLDEVEIRATERFTEVDQNGDGQISPDEAKAGAKARHDARRAEAGDRPSKGKRSHQGQRPSKGDMFARTDLDGDGVITVEEITIFTETRFKEMDSNGDGQVTLDEAKAAAPGHHGKKSR